ncbi:MAG: Aspartyl/asparaginyl beta-hydroxylase-like dioxygenase [Collimonas fungivorans]|uniref:aspartyl/asparaginyl beta-hydroxylase domain-containing protein n=1 Tax=Collimonas fungivorans TaxID=158899 RepID=UPI0026EDF9E5|nr:aspartyl/asparaginyl beta-hydroxylase domain-containing protein [Collimonas fungivorans]MDB5768144.1 Aspartyl/asparaginyl beta-hydroxylase-like dioxygenase [Collimonas fungivorans]
MFFTPSQFAFTQLLSRHWQAILAECLALPGQEFDAWPERQLYNHGWDVYGLYVGQQPLLENCIFCPHTAELLQQVPGLSHAGFSRLAAGTEISPHVGYSDQVLRLHLGLRAGEHCGIRVGAQVRRWIPGECLVFDDTVEHEAWNRGSSERLVLLVDFAKPEGAQADESS